MLNGLHVLEISSPETMLAGQILGDLGAEVLTIEPPGGSVSRRLPPFLDDQPGLENSLTWRALNRNKRGMTLDLRSPDGLWIFGELVKRVDIVVSARADLRRGLSKVLGYQKQVLCCEIVPFSVNGPKRSYETSELVLEAASGALAVTGDSDRSPLFSPIPQSILHAGAEAAIACLAALIARDRFGVTQRATVSSRTAGIFASFSQPLSVTAGSTPSDEKPRKASVGLPSVWECADGFAVVTLVPGPAFGNSTRALIAWLNRGGFLVDTVATKDWTKFPEDGTGDAPSPEDFAELEVALELALRLTTKEELQALATQHGLFVAPMRDMGEVSKDPELRSRGTFARLGPTTDHEAPIRFAKFSNYVIESRREAPGLSEHTNSILSELNLSLTEIQALFAQGVT